MKNNYLLTAAMVLGVLLTGCAASAPDTEKLIKVSAAQEKRMGLLQSLGGAYTATEATHLLRLDSGKTLYLKSKTIDLTNEKYIGKEVEVMGELIRTTDNSDVMTVENIDIIDQDQFKQEGLPQWIDFEATALGMSFKYRDDYDIQENGDSVLILRKTIKEDGIDQVGRSSGDLGKKVAEPSKITLERLSANPEELAKLMGVASLEPRDVLAGGFTNSKITQKALDAYKIVDYQGASVVYFLRNDNGVFKMFFSLSAQEEQKTDFQNMFYDILASISFSEDAIEELAQDGEKVGANVEKKVDETTKPETSDESEAETVAENSDSEEEFDQNATDTGVVIAGFSTFESTSADFSVQYPKSYYFGVNDQKEADAVRSYQFGSAPLEEEAGDIVLDVINSSVPAGKSLVVGGKAMTQVDTTIGVTLYMTENGKNYRISGPKSKLGILSQMLSTVK